MFQERRYRFWRRLDNLLGRIGLMRKSQQYFKRAEITFPDRYSHNPETRARTHIYLEFYTGQRLAGYLDPFPPGTPLIVSGINPLLGAH